MYGHKKQMVSAEEALPGRERPVGPLLRTHRVLGTNMLTPEESAWPLLEDHEPATGSMDWPADATVIVLAGGCFWGIERVAWQVDGVHTTCAGYAGGFTPWPTYEEVFSARTGHAEAVRVVFTGGAPTLRRLLEQFWQQHDPTTAMRQGNDVGTEYRSGVWWTRPEDGEIVQESAARYQQALTAAGRGVITTELAPLAQAGCGAFFPAEPEHQQYLAVNPGGYCNHGFNGVACRLST